MGKVLKLLLSGAKWRSSYLDFCTKSFAPDLQRFPFPITNLFGFINSNFNSLINISYNGILLGACIQFCSIFSNFVHFFS
ncbi:unnamed protein product [Rhizophagus irregularis]|nr:unnamed protein product [Rhizophagus irregularis]